MQGLELKENETNACESDNVITGLADAVIREIYMAHRDFCERFEASTISLRGLPMTKGDIEALDTALGKGEVNANLAVVGKSEIWETAYSGIWRIRHFSGDRIIVDEVAICNVPEILIAHIDDVRQANSKLAMNIANLENQ